MCVIGKMLQYFPVWVSTINPLMQWAGLYVVMLGGFVQLRYYHSLEGWVAYFMGVSALLTFLGCLLWCYGIFRSYRLRHADKKKK